MALTKFDDQFEPSSGKDRRIMLMSLFVIDRDKCNRDGLCVAACPARIIKLRGPVPTPVDRAEEMCINCGHCVAICPSGAILHRAMMPEQCPPVRKSLNISPEQAEQFLRARRSIRSYKRDPVDRELITKIIQIASHAPSASNSQPVRWLVIYDSDEVKRLVGIAVDWMRSLAQENPRLGEIVSAWDAGIDIIGRNAPHVIVAYAQEDNRMAAGDCTIALTYLELAAFSLEVGACWAGFFIGALNSWPRMSEALKLPEGHKSYGAMLIGYAKYKYRLMPIRNEPQIMWR